MHWLRTHFYDTHIFEDHKLLVYKFRTADYKGLLILKVTQHFLCNLNFLQIWGWFEEVCCVFGDYVKVCRIYESLI